MYVDRTAYVCVCVCGCSQPVEILDVLDALLTLDCDRRLKASAALNLPWLRNVASFPPVNWCVYHSIIFTTASLHHANPLFGTAVVCKFFFTYIPC